MYKDLFASLALFIALAVYADPVAWKINLDPAKGGVEFRASGHPSALKIVGKGAGPSGSFDITDNKVSGSATFDLDTLDTGIAMRTHHMKDKYLEVSKFHEAKLTLTGAPLPQSGEFPFTGTLSLHGIEKPVSGTAKADKSGDKITLSAQFGIKLSDFGIAVPSFAGITIADDVQVAVTDTVQILATVTPH